MTHSTGMYNSSLRLRFACNVVLVFFLAMPSFSQEGIGDLIQAARHLGRAGFHQQAVTEYQRAAFFGADLLLLHDAWYGMAGEYHESAQWEKAEAAYQRSVLLAMTDSMRDEARVALAANEASAGSPSLCMLMLLPVVRSSMVPRVRSQAAVMLLLCAVVQGDWEEIGRASCRERV